MDLHVIRKNLHENYLALAALECLEDENLSDFKKILFEHRTDPNFVLERGLAPIHFACGMENLRMAEEAVELILKKNGNPNVASGDNTDNVTPLHIAAMCGREKIVRMLLEHGGNIHLQDSKKLTPFQYAVYDCHFEVIDVIKKFVFEQKKFEENKKKGATKNNCEITNNNLALPDDDKYTPNKTNYNFDVTSPYFINITHRRLKLKFPEESLNRFPDDVPDYEAMNDKSKSFLTSTMNEHFTERRNLFELTEENLQEMAKSMMPVEKSRISLIKSWRDKVHRSRSQNSVIKKFKDIDSLLNVVTKSDEFDFTNSMFIDSTEKSPPKPFNSTSFGKLLNKLKATKSEKNTSYETALTNLNNDELTDSNFIRSPSGREYILQTAEQYVHTDVEHGIVFVEEKFSMNSSLKDSKDIKDKKGKNLDSSYSTVSTVINVPLDYDTEALRSELTQFGDTPGPITKSTKRLYIKRLLKHKRDPEKMQHLLNKTENKPTYSIELQRTINNLEHFGRIKEFFDLEMKMSEEFKNYQKLPSDKKWREGNLKQSFIYLLIDPRISNNLPLNSKFFNQHDIWKQFLNSIFYVGKGKSIRPFSHLYQALKIFNRIDKIDNNIDSVEIIDPDDNNTPNKNLKASINGTPYKEIADNKKTERILEIWKNEGGVICLHVFHNILPAEAYTREASIIDSLGLQHLTNLKRGDYYGVTSSWTMRDRKCLGTALLFKAMQIFLAEGESQLFPFDLL